MLYNRTTRWQYMRLSIFIKHSRWSIRQLRDGSNLSISTQETMSYIPSICSMVTAQYSIQVIMKLSSSKQRCRSIGPTTCSCLCLKSTQTIATFLQKCSTLLHHKGPIINSNSNPLLDLQLDSTQQSLWLHYRTLLKRDSICYSSIALPLHSMTRSLWSRM